MSCLRCAPFRARIGISLCVLLLGTALAPGQNSAPALHSDHVPLYPFRSPVNGKIGYIDSSGNIKITPQFSDCGEVNAGAAFSEGRIAVGCAPVGFADADGRQVIKPQFDEAHPFSQGLAAIKDRTRLWGYVDRNGRTVIAPRFSEAGNFSEDLAPVCNDDGLWGYIDAKGRVRIPFSFQRAGVFSGGLAPVQVNDKFGYINKAGKIAIVPQFRDAAPFSDGLAAVRSDSWHYIGIDGKAVFPGDFDQAGQFSEDLAPVKLKDKAGVGYVNRAGSFVLPPRFETGYPFRGGLALVHFKTECEPPLNQKCKLTYGYITKAGENVFSAVIPYVSKKDGSRSPAGNLLHPELAMSPVNIETSPAGAKVYLVPLDDWDSDKNLVNEKEKMLQYLQNEYTPLHDYEVIEQVYLVLLELNGVTVKRHFDVNGHTSKFLAVDFQKEK